jgi:hypothetical protein
MPCQHVAREKVLLDEVAQAAADTVLARRNDRGMRDRQAEWVPEDGRHREPVGESADHCRFRDRTHDAEPRIPRLEQPRGDEQEGEQDEEPRRSVLHHRQAACSLGLVQHDLHAHASPFDVLRSLATGTSS